MARELGKLNALVVSRQAKRGYHADGGGLYLQVGPSGSKSWVFRYRAAGRLREMGLGPTHTVSLAAARAAALEARQLRLRGLDPIAERQTAKARNALEAAKAMTFGECARAYIDAHKAGWRNAKHAKQWSATLDTHASTIMDLPVQSIDTALVLKVLEPIWAIKPETASRVRGRIESILDWARVRGCREGENPARWKGHLDQLLANRSRLRRVQHHASLPYGEVAAFMSVLRKQEGTAARALEFLILTAARTSEVIGATWAEFNLAAKVWVIPAERMKAGREHRVPLSPAALRVIERMQEARQQGDEYVFPGGKHHKPLSNMAMLKLLDRMERGDLTVHGFRSAFRDWVAECTNFSSEVAEMALAHTVENKVEAAYRRGDLFEKRRRLMDAWAQFCNTTTPQGQVVLLTRGIVR